MASKGSWRSEPWTAAEMALLFRSNAALRKLATRAVQKLRGSAAGVRRGDAEALAESAAAISTTVGRSTAKRGKSPRYPHPSVVLYWIVKGGAPAKAGSSSYSFGWAMANLMRTIRMPSRFASSWRSFLHRMGGDMETNPFYYRERIHQLSAPSSGNMLGFYLDYLDVRVPTGVVPDGDGGFRPSGFETIRINMRSKPVAERFGKVWIGVTSSGESIFLASEKAGKSVRLSELLKLSGLSRGRSSNNLPYPEPRGIKHRMPDSIKRALAEKPAKRPKYAGFGSKQTDVG